MISPVWLKRHPNIAFCSDKSFFLKDFSHAAFNFPLLDPVKSIMMPAMALSTKPYKGTRDFYPEDMKLQKWMFQKLRSASESFGYQEYDGPMLESFDLYAAKTGDEIVENQLYWFLDRGERKVAMRPEMTPTMARMVAGQLNELPKPIRWYSLPNLWRYERPKRGRLREHWQLNVDLLGGNDKLADFEILQVAYNIIKSFGGEDKIKVQINNRRLINYFFQEILKLNASSALKASKAIDARAKIGEEKYLTWMQEIGVTEAHQKQIEEFFTSDFDTIKNLYPCQGTEELENLFESLKPLNKNNAFVYDPKIMRGLDYYTGTVFEVYDTSPENNRSMFGGGRYDNLIGLFGKSKLSGIGFGMGDVTLRNFLENHKLIPELPYNVDAFVTLLDYKYHDRVLEISESLRSKNLKVSTALTTDKLAQQMKQANKLGAHFAIILGADEFNSNKISLKNLKTGEQKTLSLDDTLAEIKNC